MVFIVPVLSSEMLRASCGCTLTVIVSDLCPECPPGFIASGNSCYCVVTDNLPWSIAALRCQAMHRDAHLVAIGDDLERSALADIINEPFQSKMM